MALAFPLSLKFALIMEGVKWIFAPRIILITLKANVMGGGGIYILIDYFVDNLIQAIAKQKGILVSELAENLSNIATSIIISRLNFLWVWRFETPPKRVLGTRIRTQDSEPVFVSWWPTCFGSNHDRLLNRSLFLKKFNKTHSMKDENNKLYWLVKYSSDMNVKELG